ncbi:NAD-dependent epimerase/dehydratase family protein [Acidicapsa acidisoli]|uniref:NAD-dependent epimerase/dehydratase family protein n=1 Tax=Acidicapsa acidisoli TaxID=1615681 RepID=UPI0021E04B14|nr:NAD-dependent epimerase/dehydratase family protein [Acidicapsa acidisoli]
MSIAIITGSSGLVGSEAVSYFASLGMEVVGIDNGMRAKFFGKSASTHWMTERLEREVPCFRHYEVDIRDSEGISRIFERYGDQIALVIHAAAQPSHDWAASDPITDFTVNANGTSVMLEATRRFAPNAVFIFMSTNKVYGDRPNYLPLVELETRWEIDPSHEYANGIPESLSIDSTLHSLFGASKVAADILVQEYGRYFGMKTACFRGGCLTGPNHSGTQLHGFLAYLMKCVVTGMPYTIFGYKGKQVRDNIHSADLIRAFHEFFKSPRSGEVYNIGGGRDSNCSMLEAISLSEKITGNQFNFKYVDENRRGDHIWWVSDLSRFQQHYPDWKISFDVSQILQEIYELNVERWGEACVI